MSPTSALLPAVGQVRERARVSTTTRTARLDTDLDALCALVRSRLSRLRGLGADSLAALLGGKMLRARLALRLAGSTLIPRNVVTAVAAAVEMVHAASLLHDDLIDGGELRRGRPAFWRLTSPGASILIGDLLFSDAACLLAETGIRRILHLFCRKVREMCEAEAVHELHWRGRRLSEEQCLAVARGKTGALFAFVGSACAGEDEVLAAALQECGYRLGTAYQLADDLLDFCGAESAVGKTLGTDAKRNKLTLPALYRSEFAGKGSQKKVRELVRERILKLLLSAPRLLAPWPMVQAAAADFVDADLLGALQTCLGAGSGSGRGLCEYAGATDRARGPVGAR